MDVANWHNERVPWTLWEHQAKGADRFELQFFERNQRSLLCYCPTGGGKTILALEMIRRARRRGLRCMFMAPRYELIDQVCKKLDTFAPFGYGRIVADRNVPRSTYAELQVASLDTLVSRLVKRKNLILPPIDFVVLDEAHLYQTALREELLRMFGPETKFMGLSATPGHHDGRGLGTMFDHIIKIATVKELTEEGHLAPGRYYAPSTADMDKVKVVRGEYEKKTVGERMAPLLGDIPGTWMELGPERRTCVFAHNIGQSVFLADRFRALGVAAEHADGSMDPDLRREVFERFRSGETQVLCNVDLATYGFDLPEMSHVIMATRTRSVIRWLQMVGRGARAAKGKEDFIVQDHAGNWHEHGRHDEERYWALEGFNPKTRTGRKAGARAKNIAQLECPQCHHVFYGSLTCPECRYFFEAMAKRFQVIDGQLQEIAKDSKEAKKASEFKRRQFYAEVLGWVRERNARKPDKPWSPGWADHAYKAKFNEFPPNAWHPMQPVSPSVPIQRWLKYYVIRRAKQWKKQKAQEKAA